MIPAQDPQIASKGTLKVRTKTFVSVNGVEYAPGTLLELPERQALGMVGDNSAEQVEDDVQVPRESEWVESTGELKPGQLGQEQLEPWTRQQQEQEEQRKQKDQLGGQMGQQQRSGRQQPRPGQQQAQRSFAGGSQKAPSRQVVQQQRKLQGGTMSPQEQQWRPTPQQGGGGQGGYGGGRQGQQGQGQEGTEQAIQALQQVIQSQQQMIMQLVQKLTSESQEGHGQFGQGHPPGQFSGGQPPQQR